MEVKRKANLEEVSTALGSGEKKSKCFVATAVYSGDHCREVVILRLLRDRVIDQHLIGRMLIWSYYQIGPWMARRFVNNEWLRRPLKRVFDIFIVPGASRILEFRNRYWSTCRMLRRNTAK
jgi:hypothetical protein